MENEMEMGRVEGTRGDDSLSYDQPFEPMANGRYMMGVVISADGNDTIDVRAAEGPAQTHTYAGLGDDVVNMTFDPMVGFSRGHHARGGDLENSSAGSDTYNFADIDNVDGVIVGRIEDFNPTEDRIQIEGRTLDLANLPGNVRIVEYNGEHNEPGADPQQWLLIDTGAGSIFYSLGGARVDMNGNGTGNDGDQETHFLSNQTTPDFDTLRDVAFDDQGDYLPADATARGGDLISDIDRVASDVRATVEGTDQGDVIAAGLNDDRVEARAGDDSVLGGSGQDTVQGGWGADTIEGNAGDDSLTGGRDDDVVRGGAGDDSVEGWRGDDDVTGNQGDDMVYGNQGNDTVQGGSGDDLVSGGSGDDVVDGGSGNDWVHGGAGQDALTGGAGNDVFVFRDGYLADWDDLSGTREDRLDALDRVTDFVLGEDRLKFTDHGDVGSLDDLTASLVEVDGNAHALLQVDATDERLLIDVAEDVTWATFFVEDSFVFV